MELHYSTRINYGQISKKMQIQIQLFTQNDFGVKNLENEGVCISSEK
jgi:hypothetical protein